MREGERVLIELSANAFLHHMVRNIAGVLMDIGAGKHEPGWAKELLDLRDRTQASATAPADGLYLGGVYYPEEFGLGKHPIFELLPADACRYDPAKNGDAANT
jgi:tRNA pseudouridine38-40 synthase